MRSSPDEIRTDVVIVGSGVAGLTCARTAAAAGLSVIVLTKAAADDGSTRYAQGGIAVADGGPAGSVAEHVADTMAAGGGLNEIDAVRDILAAGPAAVRRLIAGGARFDTGARGLLRSREGGHLRPRIVHAGGDATGAEVERALLASAGLPVVLEDTLVLDIAVDTDGVACGVRYLDPADRVCLIRTGAVVLATGGAGRLYAASTNPEVATADGIGMALRAGAVVSDLEFYQFHPTALWTGRGRVGRRPLVTEALRGAGARLVDVTGRAVMTGVHPLGDLAPRDVVAAAITRRLAQRPGGVEDHVFLDATGVTDVAIRFPTVFDECTAIGVDPQRDPVPVSPAAHYQCGGVWTDRDGRTTVPGLYAVGEVARTGLHGANRLASNSLLEGLVTGERAAAAVRLAIGRPNGRSGRPAGCRPDTEVVPAEDRWVRPEVMRDVPVLMSAHAGIGRDASGLSAVATAVAGVLTARGPMSRAAVAATNLAQASSVLLAAATERTETRGCHVRSDEPATADSLAHSLHVTWVDGGPVVRHDVPVRVGANR